MKAAVLALVLQAVVRLGKRALKGRAQQGVAALSFAAIFAFGVPFPLIVAGAAVLGWSAAKAGWTAFQAGGGHGAGDKSHVEDAATLLGAAGGDAAAARAGAFQAGLAALALWLVPVGVLMLVAPGSVFTDIAVFFSQMAVLTFGGAYAVLAWVAQEAVGGYGWLSAGEMLDGLGMAETTPGPLIMVLQFVGFMAALREAGWAEPLWAATLGGLLATWVTFAPCFAWIFLGAPFMERLRANAALASALATVTAAVVGVIVNLALWFAVHVIWQEVTRVDWGMVSLELPVLATVNWAAAGLTGLALWAVFGLRLGLAQVLGGAAAAGLGLHALGLV
jgi:chromate transporter